MPLRVDVGSTPCFSGLKQGPEVAIGTDVKTAELTDTLGKLDPRVFLYLLPEKALCQITH